MELHPHRARMLRKLVASNNVQVIAADARNPPTSAVFDCVLADVPCSGTGTLARNPEIKWRLQVEDLADLQTRQLNILISAMQRVSPAEDLFIRHARWRKKKTQQWWKRRCRRTNRSASSIAEVNWKSCGPKANFDGKMFIR